MPRTHRLKLPLTEEAVRSLSLGDTVYLDGEIVLAGTGIPAHERILSYLDSGKPLPIDLHGAAIFHFGSYSRLVNGAYEVLYMNPTTSSRFNPYMPRIIRSFGLRAVGGKGGFDAPTAQAMKETGCVYLSYLGGGCTILSESIKKVLAVAWDDFIFQYRMVKLLVEGFGPGTVGIDANGNSLYEILSESAKAKLPEILKEADRDRAGAPESNTDRAVNE
jgi:fumarate hydratase subunit beta